MPKPAFAESVLALLTDRPRAAAIYGDLLELSATHNRLWFAAAYLRTLIALTWRAPVAFLIGLASFKFFLYPLAWLQMKLIYIHIGSSGFLGGGGNGLFGGYAVADTPLAHALSRLPLRIELQQLVSHYLIFALVFAWARFGWRNRVTQLAGALVLLALPILTRRPALMDLSGVCDLLAIVAALLLPLWRRPLLVLATTCLAAVVPIAAPSLLWFCVLVPVFHRRSMSAPPYFLCEDIGLVFAAIVCVYLQARSTRQTSTPPGAVPA